MAIRGLHAISPNSGSNISLSVPYLMKMKMNPPADYEVCESVVEHRCMQWI